MKSVRLLRRLPQRRFCSAAGHMLWGGRFTGGVDPDMNRFNRSFPFDKNFWKQDIQGSKAYAKALEKAGLLTGAELTSMLDGLTAVEQEWIEGTFKELEADEDIHSANERRLLELIGDTAKKLHTGRSRNDQVSVDLKLWCREEYTAVQRQLLELIQAMTECAAANVDILMPGYTHLQRAQPVRFSHWLLAHTWPLKRDCERLSQLIIRNNVMPLGSGALAGNPFNIDREALAADLGFSGPSPNSMDGTMDRDIVAEFLQWSSLCSIHLSRWAEDIIIYNSREYNFITLADAYSTGSSLMPQKKNPDSLELIRGKTGRVFGKASGFLMTMKGLPSCYNKDLQEDKEALFDTVDTMNSLLRISTGVISTVTVNGDQCSIGLSEEMLATDIAYYLVRKGVPFRTAHEVSGQCVVAAEKGNCNLSDLSISQLKEIDENFDEDVATLWNYESSVEQYQVVGGTAKSSVLRQIDELREFAN